MIKMTHMSTIKDHFGLFDVCVKIGKKEYTFVLKSEYDVEQFNELKLYHPGKALNYLKKYGISNKNIS